MDSQAPRRRNPRGQGGKLRGDLIGATRTLLASAQSEAEVSIRAVTKAARVAPQSFYLQFASRDELLYAVYALEYGELARRLSEAGNNSDPVAHLRAVCGAYLDFAAANPGGYRVLASVRGHASHPGWGGRPLPGHAAFELIQQAVTNALAKRRRHPDPFLVASALWASLHGLATLIADRPAFPWPPTEKLLELIVAQTVGTAAQGPSRG
ncbi:MAG: TetR/AcrR family transcriptional regulator [Candidatus Dormibacteria bacterium]